MRSDVVKKFLTAQTHSDLAMIYESFMQCHVLVSSDGSTNRDGATFTNGIETWYPFVISDNESDSKIINFNFDAHVEGIGLTGWDWKNKLSRWVAFDFDSIVGHKKGLTDGEIKEISGSIAEIDYVTIRKSTGGKGLHIYVTLNPPIPTTNRSEHAALARAILHKISAQSGVPLKDKVDICGGNMFVWHRKMTKENQGLLLIKQGKPLDDVPNWKDQIDFVIGGKPRVKDFDGVATAKIDIAIDEEHKKLINFLQERRAMWYWDGDKHMLVCHTADLADAHKEMNLRGIFRTVATGKNRPDINCFAFPLRQGGWVVRRFGAGTAEDTNWDLDDKNWRKCYFNVDADIKTASQTFGGIEHTSGAYVFKTADEAGLAASALGVHLALPDIANYCTASIKEHKDGRLIVSIEDKEHKIPQSEMQGWIKEKATWKRLYIKPRTVKAKEDNSSYDDFIRHLVSPSGEDYGWALRTEEGWNFEALAHVRLVLESMGLPTQEVRDALGNSVMKCWKIVNIPFKDEYPGGRQWNRNSAQIRFQPSLDVTLDLAKKCPSWWRILSHCGAGLDDIVKMNDWAKSNNIHSGAEYLITWIASMFQEPTEPLPYLFFYGPQNSGKSIFHEALSLLVTNGIVKADNALINKSGFNAEMESAVLCVVEEINLAKSREAANRIKDWVTARDIMIHRKGKTPYMMPNVSHWVQMSNDHDACPIFPGDTRIVVLFVDKLNIIIPKKKLIDSLIEEARDFMAYIINYNLPESFDRLNVPVIATSDKMNIEQSNKSMLEMFIDDECFRCDGEMIKFSEFCDKFMEWLGPTTEFWSKQKIGKELPPMFPKGRLPQSGQFYVGNITFDAEIKSTGKCVVLGDKLIKQETVISEAVVHESKLI
ncbi:MAG TPA: DUF5906 domain-containing protein [Candidatus Cloacimonadota bacterium]|nr:DUF5906 domain-containing protein [Candidatus Cloacimonadota bacterium]